MTPPTPSAAGQALTELMLETFRLNGKLLQAGDRLVAPLGLTSARWQVLGAIHFAETPQPVAWLARSMGLHRQGVQRIVNELEKEGLVAFEPNPHHRRAQLVVFTDKGRAAYDAAEARHVPWSNALAEGLDGDELRRACAIMAALRARLAAEAVD